MKIYNTMSKRKEEFTPLEEGKVKMYVCGPTVYNLIHIGNARPMIVFDTVRRYFQYKGYDVTASADLSGYSDIAQVSSYALAALQWAKAEGLVNGTDTTLTPDGSATRAQVAVILMRFCENVAK